MLTKNMLASILFFFISFIAMAQGGTPPPPTPPPPPGLPVDGGIVALFCVALVFGVYKTIKISNPKKA